MLKRIKARLKNRSGFTLAELLITLIILLLAATIVTTGVPAAANALRKTVDASNAQLLLSTTMTRLRGELSAATVDKDKTGEQKITYTNAAGIPCVLYCGEYEDKTTHEKTEGILLKAETDSEKVEYLLVSKQAAGSLVVSFNDASYDETSGVVTISGLKVTKGGSTLAAVTNDAGGPGDYMIRVLGG